MVTVVTMVTWSHLVLHLSPFQGIKSHIDLLRFEDGIAILSLGSPCIMTFQKTTELVPKHAGGQDCVRDCDTAIASDLNHGCCRGKAGGEAGGGGRKGGVGERCEEAKDMENSGGVRGSEGGVEEGRRARERRCERDDERKRSRLGGVGALQKEVIHHCVGSNNHRCNVDGVEDRVRGDRCHQGQSGSWEGHATSACAVEKVHDDVSLTLLATDVTSSPECAVVATMPVLLGVGDLLIISGEARYDWSHGIHRGLEHQMWKGESVKCRKRMSLTLRRMCQQE